MVDKWISCDMDVEVPFGKFSLLETSIYSSDWDRKEMGTAVWTVSDVSQYPYCKAQILGASDRAYYRYYNTDQAPPEERELDRIDGEFFLHFCSDWECDDSWHDHEVGDEEYVHVFAWRVISNTVAKELLRTWNIQPPHKSWFDKAYQANYRHKDSYEAIADQLKDVQPFRPAASTGITVAVTEVPKAAPKKKGPKDEKSLKKRKKYRDVPEPPEPPSKGAKRKSHPPGIQSVLDAELARLREVMQGNGEPAGVAPAAGKTALALRDPKEKTIPARPTLRLPVPDSDGSSQGSGSAAASPKEKKPAEVLAHRASQHAEKRKINLIEDHEGPATTALDKLVKYLQHSGSGPGGDDEEVDGLDAGEQKRMAYRRLAKEKPGVLLQRLLKLMREQVTSLTGDMDEEDSLSPVCVRFFLSIFLPNYRELGETQLREIRTLCEALDGLLRGRTLETGDLLAMRLKAAMLAAQEGSWQVARHLELLPPVQRNLPLNQDEETLIRKVEAGDMKLRDLVDKIKKGKQD